MQTKTLFEALPNAMDSRDFTKSKAALRQTKEISNLIKTENAQGRCALDLIGHDAVVMTQKALKPLGVPRINVAQLTKEQLMEWRTLMFAHKTAIDRLKVFAAEVAGAAGTNMLTRAQQTITRAQKAGAGK